MGRAHAHVALAEGALAEDDRSLARMWLAAYREAWPTPDVGLPLKARASLVDEAIAFGQ